MLEMLVSGEQNPPTRISSHFVVHAWNASTALSDFAHRPAAVSPLPSPPGRLRFAAKTRAIHVRRYTPERARLLP